MLLVRCQKKDLYAVTGTAKTGKGPNRTVIVANRTGKMLSEIFVNVLNLELICETL